MSLYWLVPAAMAGETGEAVAAFTEQPENVASTSSYAETCGCSASRCTSSRTAGWPCRRGRLPDQPAGPWPASPPALAAACALLARARARALAALLLAVAVPVMVGLFPPAAPSPFGRLLSAAFERVPGAIAFRTTNKAGALVALAYALLLGLGAAELFRRRRARAALAGVVAAASRSSWPWRCCRPGPAACTRSATRFPATGGSWPPTSTRGRATPGSCSPPGPATPPTAGAWRGPTTSTCRCCRGPRWSGPPCPTASFEQTNFLAALDLPLSTGEPEVVAAMARYLGVAEVVVRNDQRWEASAGRAVGGGQGPGRRPVAAAGLVLRRPGEHTVAPVSDFYRPEPGPRGRGPAPLQRYAVARPRPIVRAEPARGAMLVDGDSFALPSLVRLGLAPASRRSGCSSPRTSWPPRWPTGPGWWSPTATGGGPGAACTGQNYSPTSGPTSLCPRRP